MTPPIYEETGELCYVDSDESYDSDGYYRSWTHLSSSHKMYPSSSSHMRTRMPDHTLVLLSPVVTNRKSLNNGHPSKRTRSIEECKSPVPSTPPRRMEWKSRKVQDCTHEDNVYEERGGAYQVKPKPSLCGSGTHEDYLRRKLSKFQRENDLLSRTLVALKSNRNLFETSDMVTDFMDNTLHEKTELALTKLSKELQNAEKLNKTLRLRAFMFG